MDRTVPTSTVNITGFFHWMSGRSMTKERTSAVLSSSGANSPCLRVRRRADFGSAWGMVSGMFSVMVAVMVLFHLPVGFRDEGKSPHDYGGPVGGSFGHCGVSRPQTSLPRPPGYMSASKRHGTQVFGHRGQHCRRHEQQRTDQQDGPQQEQAERERVGA